jgi:aspartyl-tRNA(Asn)/glutamyl-tRNA(Gln) amidotransferase subunit C
MAVSEDDVRHVAGLARLGLPEARLPELVGELNRILEHMEVLAKVDTSAQPVVAGVGSGGTPLREDEGPQYPLARSPDAFAPAFRDGFFLVPRLATHESAGGPPDPAAAQEAGE